MCNESQVSRKLIYSGNRSGNKMKDSGNQIIRKFNLSIAFAIFIVILVVPSDSLPHGRSLHPRAIRLCSKNLSDALYLVCQSRGGFNEPFSYSGEETNQAYSSGPGISEECCYHSCSLEQLAQYCKPLKKDESYDNSQEGIQESLRIVNLPEELSRALGTDERHVVTRDEHNVQTEKKSKLRSVTGVRRAGNNKKKRRKHAERPFKISNLTKKSHKGRRLRGHKDVPYTNKKNNDSANDRDGKVRSKHISRHHKRSKRLLRFKLQALRDAANTKVPEFKVGTTLPDPKDSTILIFPSRINLVIQRTAKDLAASENTGNLE